MREWGRRGSPGTVWHDTNQRRADAEAAERRSVRRRLRDGYTGYLRCRHGPFTTNIAVVRQTHPKIVIAVAGKGPGQRHGEPCNEHLAR